MAVKLSNFQGRKPAVAARMLPIGAAQISQNVSLGSGAMRATKGLGASVHAPANSSPKTIYKFGSTWLDFAAQTWLCPAALSGVSRLLMCDDSTLYAYPVWRDSSGTIRRWGVVKPSDSAAIAVSAVNTATDAIVVDTVSYVYTLVTASGEESAPNGTATSPLDILTGQCLSISGFCVNATNDGTGGAWFAATRNEITHIRVYRLASTASGSAEFQRVALRPTIDGTAVFDIPVASIADTSDTWFDANAGHTALSQDLGAALQTEGWDAPPADLTNAVMFQNGMYAGSVGQVVYLSMPGFYYAMPATGTMDYSIECAYTVVAMAAFNESLVVGTTANPEVISGVDAASMSRQPMPYQQPCLSKQGMVSMPDGVAYVSPDGLFFIGSSGGFVMTEKIFTRETWQAMPPSGKTLADLICVYHNQRIYMFFQGSRYGMVYDRDLDYIVDIYLSDTVYAAYVDPVADLLYLGLASTVKAFDQSALYLTATWRSGIIETPPINWPMARLQATIPEGSNVVFTYYVDGVLKKTKAVTTDEPFWLPSGFRGRDHEIALAFTDAVIDAVYLGTSPGDIQNV